jgi:hypothetical protein
MSFPIVGIGAYAGGLESFSELLARLPAETGMAYVFRAASLSFRGALCFAFGQKIWHTIFFSSKPNFKISLKLLLEPRGASPVSEKLACYGSSALSVIIGEGFFSFQEAGLL